MEFVVGTMALGLLLLVVSKKKSPLSQAEDRLVQVLETKDMELTNDYEQALE